MTGFKISDLTLANERTDYRLLLHGGFARNVLVDALEERLVAAEKERDGYKAVIMNGLPKFADTGGAIAPHMHAWGWLPDGPLVEWRVIGCLWWDSKGAFAISLFGVTPGHVGRYEVFWPLYSTEAAALAATGSPTKDKKL